MRTFVLAGTLALSTVVGLEATPPKQLTHPQLPRIDALQKLGLKMRWHTYVPVDGVRDGIAVAQSIDNQFVVQTFSGSVSALDGETGRTQWRSRFDTPYGAHKGDAAANGRMLFVTSNARLFGVTRGTGNVEWSIDLPGILSTGPAADIDRLYLCTAEGRVAAFMLPMSQAERRGQTAAGYGGRSTEISENLAALAKPERVWDFQLEAAVLQPPVVFSTHVVFADGKGSLFSFQRGQHNIADLVKNTVVISAPMAKQGDMIYVASQDHNVYAYQFEVGSLQLRWQYAAGSKVLHKPMVIGDDVYIFSELNGLHCLDRETGQRRWRQSEAHAFAGASKRLLVTTDASGRLLVLDRKIGQPVGKFDTSDFAIIVRNDGSNRIYLANHDGLVVCLQDLDPSEEAPVYYQTPPKQAEPKPAAEPAAEAPGMRAPKPADKEVDKKEPERKEPAKKDEMKEKDKEK